MRKIILAIMILSACMAIVGCNLPGPAIPVSIPVTVTSTADYPQPIDAVCTAPVCEDGKLVCGESAGCPGGCGTICQAYTPTPAGTVVFDFAAQLCNAKWMTGGQNLTACPAQGADHSGGFAELVDPVSVGYPFNLQVLRMIPSWNGYSSLFLRYPPLMIDAADHFQRSSLVIMS